MLGACNADRDRQAELCPHAAPDRTGDLGRRAEQMRAAGDIGEGLVDRNPLDQWGEIIEHLDRSITQPLVLLEMAVDEDQARTKLARPPSWHTAADAESLGLV